MLTDAEWDEWRNWLYWRARPMRGAGPLFWKLSLGKAMCCVECCCEDASIPCLEGAVCELNALELLCNDAIFAELPLGFTRFTHCSTAVRGGTMCQ